MAVLVLFTGGKEVSFFHSAIKFISFVKMMRNLRQYVELSFLIQISLKNWKKNPPNYDENINFIRTSTSDIIN